MDLNEKIKQILADKNITSSHFADEIGVPRSSVSHILVGRNKPSLDIVQKIIRRYPDLGMEWILDGAALPDIKVDQSAESETNLQKGLNKKHVSSTLESHIREEPATNTVQTNLVPDENGPVMPGKSGKEIAMVLIFYSDGTFKQHVPY